MKRAVLILLIVSLLGAGAFGLGQYLKVQSMRVELAAVSKDRDDLQGKLRDSLRARPATTVNSDPAAAPVGKEMAVTEARGGTTPAVAVSPNRVQPESARFNAVMNSPEVQQLMAIQQKAALDGPYAALFRRLNLGPAELEKFKHLLVEKQAVIMDVMAAARNQGMGGRENRDELRQLVESNQAEIDQSIRTTLGDAVYAQYKNYETTLPQRGLVDQLGQRLSYSTTPLTDAQTEQLVGILASNTTPSNAGSRNPVVMPMIAAFPRVVAAGVAGGGVRVTDEVVAQARGVLSGPQLAALQSLQQEQQAAAALTEQLRVNRQNQQRGNTGPAAPGGG